MGVLLKKLPDQNNLRGGYTGRWRFRESPGSGRKKQGQQAAGEGGEQAAARSPPGKNPS
jgi:hypothetical protein